MNPQVILFGVLSAVLAGIADFCAALVSRRLGTFWTLLTMIFGSTLVLGLAQLFWGRPISLSWHDTLVVGLIAAAALVGYLTFYRALVLGPVAVVSPIAAC